MSFCIMQPMPDPQDQFTASIASEAVEILEDHLLFPGGHLLPLSARGSGMPGMADRPWSRLTADVFYSNLPVIYSLALRREPPDVLRGSLRAVTASRGARFAQLVLVNGTVGVIVAPRGRLLLVVTFKITGKRIVEIDVIADPVRLSQLDLAVLND